MAAKCIASGNSPSFASFKSHQESRTGILHRPKHLGRGIARCGAQAGSATALGAIGNRYILTDELKQRFHEDGYVHIPAVMSDAELQQHIDPVYFKYVRGELKPKGKDLCDMSGAKGRTPDEFTVYNVMLPRVYHQAWQGNLFEARCKDIADQLQGGDMMVDYDQILAKRPNSGDSVFAWHQDMAYWPPLQSSVATATCWLAVSDSTQDNGCMRFLPGSHQEPQLRRHFPVGASRADSHALFTAVDEASEGVRYVPIRRGDITVHNERVVHGSGPNLSPGWRHAYVLAFRKAACVAEERSLGFTHSHNDVHSWDVFNRWTQG